jgi:hypothetical protein
LKTLDSFLKKYFQNKLEEAATNISLKTKKKSVNKIRRMLCYFLDGIQRWFFFTVKIINLLNYKMANYCTGARKELLFGIPPMEKRIKE